MVESTLLNGHVPSIFIWSFKFIHEWGEKKEIPTLVKQIFVTSNITMMLFIYRQAAFCRCWYLWMEDSLPVTCNLSSANMRLLTLVMTTSGEGDFFGVFFFGGGRGELLFFFRSNSNASSTEARSAGNPPLLVLWLKHPK